MYVEHFGLNEKPFSISPDPRYLYMSQRHADALAHLVYGISETGGFIQLTGEVGTGKTTLIRRLLGQLPDRTEIALILNPHLSTKQFLQAICAELHVPIVQRDTAKTLIDKLNTRLLALHAENSRVVLIVDEAQTMSPVLLEQVRLLTNLETEKQKLLQIILIGQPELRELLGQPEMRQIAQRITGRYHLEPLDAPDTELYVAHRMKVAGGRPEVFNKRAIRRLYKLSRGLPRLINIIADRSLLAAYSKDEHMIGASLIGKAADEVFGRPKAARWWPFAAAVCLAALLSVSSSSFIDSEPDPATFRPEPILAVGDTALPEPSPTAIEPFSETQSPASDQPSLQRLLAAGPATDGRATQRALFNQWGIDGFDTTGAACESASVHGLECLRLFDATLEELGGLNRPAAVEVELANDERRHLLLLNLDRRDAAVWISGAVQIVPVTEIESLRLSDALILFRPAIDTGAGPLAAGARGPSVIWLRTSLGSLSSEPGSSTEPDLFDSVLATAVSAFKRTRGLPVDGTVDALTLAWLQSAIGLVEIPLNDGAI